MNLETAIAIATKAHKNQKDKFGNPYLLHLLSVMKKGNNEKEKITGVLHDLIEDTEWTLEDLRQEGFDEEIISAIDCLTKRKKGDKEESYEKFISRVKKNALAIRVKLNDLEDNMDVRRIPKLTVKDVKRINKYLKAYRSLKNLTEKVDSANNKKKKTDIKEKKRFYLK